MATRIEGDTKFTGNVTVQSLTSETASITGAMLTPSAAVVRSQMAQEALESFPVNMADLRVWDAMQTNLPGTAATDDLAFSGGTFATNAPRVTAGDLKAAGATTRYARFQVALPPEYEDGETVTLRIKCGMLTTVADVSCTIDAQVYEMDGATAIGADICATAATTMNSLTFGNKDFTITPTALAAGDVLDVRLAIACNDAATATVVEPAIGLISLLCDIRG